MSVISADFPFESRFVEVYGSQIHYVEQGEGSPVLFLHGNPTSSYVWRNVIPHVVPHGRAIAMDLIGMGKSDKPDIDYRFVDHFKYLHGFIEALGLRNIIFVLHEWGAALGLHYAMSYEAKIKGVAFMEAILEPIDMEVLPEAARELLTVLRDEESGEKMVIEQNFFVESFLPSAMLRDMTRREMAAYREPFAEPASRKPLLRWLGELPIGDEPADVTEIVKAYGAKLRDSELPKLLLYATPGSHINPPQVDGLEQSMPNLVAKHLGDGIHYLQEDAPEEIGKALADWIKKL